MKNKTVIIIFSLIAFVSICFTACENLIIKKWWADEQKEPDYIALLKILPGSYDTVVQEKIVYRTVFEQLPPQTVYDTVYEDKPVYQYIYEKLPPEVIYQTKEVQVPEYITVYQDVIKQIPPDKDTIIQWLSDPANEDDVKEIVKKIKEQYPDQFIDYVYEQVPPEIIYQEVEKTVTVYQDVIKQIPPDRDTIIQWLTDQANKDDVDKIVEKIKELYPDAFTEYVNVPVPPQIIYQQIEVIKEVPEYITVYQDVIKQIPPDKDTIIQWLSDPANEDDVKEIIKKIKELYPDEFIDYVYEQLPPEIIYQDREVIKTVYQDVIKQIPPDKDTIIQWLKDPANQSDVDEIIREIKDKIPIDVIKEIIKEIPPKDIMEYLTDDQIKYIVSQQPSHIILQSIKIIGIEYVIFAGDSSEVNGAHGPNANTDLTPQEKDYNTSSINEMAQLLRDNPTYIIMLHGHANPTSFTDGETLELTKLSLDRANDVRRVLLDDYNKLPVNPDNPPFDDRVSCNGYGGEKTLFGNNSSYTPLNRRVEMILFEIVTTVEN